MPKPRLLARQQGVAVVTALLLTTLAITIVASLFWQQQVQVRSIENQRLQLQKQWILRGALDWARLILREDAKFSRTDTLDEPWAVPLADTRLDQYVENGQADTDAADAVLSGSIADAQSRFNLANLAQNGSINAAEVTVFERLLTNAQIDPSFARKSAQLIASSQTKLPNSGQNNGQNNTPVRGGGENERLMPFSYVEDLLTVPGFTSEMLEKLKEFVVLLPRPTAVNANTAPAEVLAAKLNGVSLSEANTLVGSRKGASFRDTADISNRLSGRSVDVLGRNLEFQTSYFLVNGNVRMSRAGLAVQALIERNGASTKLLWIKEN